MSRRAQTALEIRTEVSSTLDAFADLWPSSGSPTRAACYPFQYADVLRVLCDTVGKARGVEPVFVSVGDRHGNPWMLLPLGIESSAGVRVLSYLDFGISDYNAPVLFPEARPPHIEAAALWQRIAAELPRYDVALLEKMPPAVEGVANPLAGLATGDHPESCHKVSLHGCSSDFEGRFLPNARDSSRRFRKLEKNATVSFTFAQTDKDRKRIFQALIRMKRQRFHETSAYDLFADAGYLDFYERLTHELGRKGAVILSALNADGQIIAADWGLVGGKRFYDLLPSYETGPWRSFAPGRLLTEWMMKELLGRGFREFDYGIGDESYKFDYCDVHIALKDAWLPATTKGTAYLQALKLGQAARHGLRDTKVGTAIKAARNLLRRHLPQKARQTAGSAPVWIAALGTASLAIDV